MTERTISFFYDYKLLCATCRQVTPLTSQDYYNEINGAHVDCAHCGKDIHFGRLAFTLRDPGDPALDDQHARAFNWYHTSTYPDWPTSTRTMPTPNRAMAAVFSEAGLRDARERYETQALHLGTYEAAIESMLRRMRNQADGKSQFYLYRVVLRETVAFEAGYRDENHAPAAQITQAELGDHDAIRYANVYEAPGSISLAVHPRAIAATQRIALPVVPAALDVTAAVVFAAKIHEQVAKLEAERPDTLSRLDQIRAAAAKLGKPAGRSRTPEQYDLLARIDDNLEDTYLDGVSLPLRRHFTDALHSWREDQSLDNHSTYVERFAALAATLTDPPGTQRELMRQPTRELDT